jgi:pectate lyase
MSRSSRRPLAVRSLLALAAALPVYGPACSDDGAVQGPEMATDGGMQADLPSASSDAAAGTPPKAGAPVADPTEPGAGQRDASTKSPDAAAAPGDAGGPSASDSAADGTIDAGPVPDAGPTDPGAPCPNGLLGWATVSGEGDTTTAGGGRAATVRPNTADELAMYAGDATPRVIEIDGTFDVPSLQVASHKTLRGIGSKATLRGAVRIRGKADAPVHDVILQNLNIDGKTSAADGDAVQLVFAHHIWLDHIEVWDGPDGNLDITHASSWITVSNSRFRYTDQYRAADGEAADHRFSSLVGHSDNNEKEDKDRLKVTFHHNHWAQGVLERMPRVRFGQVHVMNNYFAAPGNNYCVRAGRGAQLLVEANHFDGVKSPQQFNSDADQATANITARDNLYTQTSGDMATGGGGPAFSNAPYDAHVAPASTVRDTVLRCAGPK